MKKQPVVHFEMPADDPRRMANFYSTAFGWETNQMGPEYGEYITVMTTESDDKGPLEKGAINGGIYPRTEADQQPRIVIAVDDIDNAIQNVLDAGGTLKGSKDDIPNVGIYQRIIDTEGNLVALLQPSPRM